MKKLVTMFLVLSIFLNSCASTFGTPGNQSEKQRKTDKIVSRTILGTLMVGAVILVISSNDKGAN